ncbi:MAG: tRNA (N6-threonylcarbamoyladenosine(37)-N6)-methyltransferase TrmO [Hornefia sp.]|nr:tRNA (N6-threonylcarbamoyladenosine(37)-N6)-methyltransferase TrmO [Hornefia sp.]
MELFQIAHMESKYKEKFGISRQAGLVKHAAGRIVFEDLYRELDSVRGLEEFSHIWILWGFHKNPSKRRGEWSPTVRPPKLGGRLRKGVFATRSPNRPNPIGLSCVEIFDIDINSPGGPFIYVSGVDLLDGTPIYDIKPFIPYADNHPDAKGGFSEASAKKNVDVVVRCPEFQMLQAVDSNAIVEILKQDPRDAYEKKENHEYGIFYGEYNVKFHAENDTIYIDKIEKDSFTMTK